MNKFLINPLKIPKGWKEIEALRGTSQAQDFTRFGYACGLTSTTCMSRHLKRAVRKTHTLQTPHALVQAFQCINISFRGPKKDESPH